MGTTRARKRRDSQRCSIDNVGVIQVAVSWFIEDGGAGTNLAAEGGLCPPPIHCAWVIGFRLQAGAAAGRLNARDHLEDLPMSEREINQKAAEEIRSTYRLNGQEFLLGDWVGLLDGKVVAIAKDIDTAFQTVRKLDPDPHRGMIVHVGPPAVDVIR